jgi:hypothetical protein
VAEDRQAAEDRMTTAQAFMALLDFAGLLPPNRETPRRFTVAPWRER